MPSSSLCEAGTTPLAMKVVTTGMFSFSANASNSSEASMRMTPWPARMSGEWEASSRAATSSSCAGFG